MKNARKRAIRKFQTIRTTTNRYFRKGTNNWRNFGRSVWSSKETALKNTTVFYCRKNKFHPKSYGLTDKSAFDISLSFDELTCLNNYSNICTSNDLNIW